MGTGDGAFSFLTVFLLATLLPLCPPCCYTQGMKAPEIKITYSHTVKASERIKIKNSSEAADIFREIINELGYMDHSEVFVILLINRRKQMLGWHLVSIGSQVCTIVDPKIVFQPAIVAHANGIIGAHNHPSDDCSPSTEDGKLMKRLVDAGMILELPLLDHLILSNDNYYSYADEGTLQG